ncbi:spore germination protein [Paenibacillus sp. UNC451MF]|uniref:spore germination protein n=1 Tax=Paenibacillus sp. UNC451MF TaxID=1449063 RepID=UPI00048E63EB|nr:spore germination protein [Paenibacillus sp. UNC451MF]
MSIFTWLRRHIHPPVSNSPTESQQQGQPTGAATDQLDRSIHIDARVAWFQKQLSGNSDVIIQNFTHSSGTACALLFIKNMIDLETLQKEVLQAALSMDAVDAADFCKQIFDDRRLPVTGMHLAATVSQGLLAILEGHALLLVEGDCRILDLPVTSYPKRAIDEAPNESVIRGPREAFIESLQVNTTLIRRRLKTPDLKLEYMKIGRHTHTDVAIGYIQGVCKPELVQELKRRLSQIDVDGLMGSSYIEEFIEDNPYSPFPQMQYTERPDVVCASLLEGRIVIIVDGTPIVLLAPVTMFMLMQSAEDYYQRFISSTWIRWIRFAFIFISLLLPSTYIAVTTVHPEIIPKRLLVTITSSREVVPFPALIEAFMMELAFEALREAAIRIPKSIGQAVSIIGALIIGTAAVQAGIVSAAMVIIVALTGIASFIIPHYDLGLAFRLLRFPIMILAGMFGLFGIACGLILVYLHLLSLRSFGTPYLTPLTPLSFSDWKDTFIRAPWWLMKKRPSLSSSGTQRQSKNTRRWDHEEEDED